ncbi:putative E3 ubiquitin-protein ligase DTX2 [Channa argus]|uniref:E3 ubiquitin-protein ligase n=1 Tax=Channa argus TaxID=215402 RepID=A0A6G1QTQ8_CHAAH|nr:putative E3 ubiquitin-protein ligase DTX2 [Channa argus]
MAIVSGSCARVNGSRNGPSVSGTPSGSVGQSQPMIAVWEWQDDLGYWRPYSGQVSAYIERCLSPRGQRGGPGSTSICLGQSDPSLSPYLIDIPSLKQFRQDTGKTRPVRRSLFAQSSGLGSGVYWEWANDEGGWTPYETRTSILLEHSYQARQGTADLGPHGYNYIVDLTSLAQVNKSTGFRRQVRRQCNLPYPLVSSGPPTIPSGPACSCQQCLSHSSTGPMPSRSRHSFSSGSLNRPSLQGTGRAAAAHPTSVYSPYPRRPLSVGGMSWGSPWPPPPPCGSQLSAPPLTNSTSANGLSVPTIPVQLNGSTSVSSALAASAPRPEEVIQRYMEVVAGVPDEDGSLQCPSCKTIYGEKTGTQPKGKMEIYSIAQSLPGHPDCGTIQIIYSIPPGIQVLELLKVAWMRRLIFTVGTSSTTGEPDTVVWNGIHHKTEMMSNLSGHGYPDPNYLDNVLSELASQGVTEDCLKPPGGGGSSS